MTTRYTGVIIEGYFIACDTVTLTVESRVLDKLTKKNHVDIRKILKLSIITRTACAQVSPNKSLSEMEIMVEQES